MNGIEEWDSETWKKRISVTGILRHKSLAPNSNINSEGEISHGVDEDIYVLENPTWTICQ
jgi:hypothetical protein